MTSNVESEIYDSLINELNGSGKAFKTITEISFDKANGRSCVTSSYSMLDFDSFNSRRYGSSASDDGSHKEKTPDALYCDGENLVFIEFKNGEGEKNDVRMKIHEALLGLFNYAVISKKILSRDKFFELKITYTVIKKANGNALNNPFYRATYLAKDFFLLKSMDGFLIKKTHVLVEPEKICSYISHLTLGKAEPIQAFAQ